MTTTWLIDKSALVRLGRSHAAADWASRIQRGLVVISTVTRLEVGSSARSASDLTRAFATAPLAAMPVEYSTPAIEIGRWRCNGCWRNGASIARRRYRTF